MKLRNLMIHHSVLKKLEDYIKLLQDLDSHLCTLNTHKPIFSRSFLKPTTFSSASSTQFSYSSFKPSYSLITSFSALSISPFKSASSFDPMPMNLSNARRTSLTAEKKTRRVQLELCCFCEEAEHQQITCQKFKCYNCEEIDHSKFSCIKLRQQRLQEIQLKVVGGENLKKE